MKAPALRQGHPRHATTSVVLGSQPSGPAPKPPRGLEKSGRAAWRRLWDAGASWLSPASDYAILERLCRGYDELERWRQRIEQDGAMINGSQHQQVIHPGVAAMRTLEMHLTRWESLCGFTPSDRSRLGLSEVRRVSELDEFLDRRARRHSAE